MNDSRMDQILNALDTGRQRATYGAVAALLDTAPRTLMNGRNRDTRSSWVVSRKTGEPTGYEPEQLHPDLRTHDQILDSREALENFLTVS